MSDLCLRSALVPTGPPDPLGLLHWAGTWTLGHWGFARKGAACELRTGECLEDPGPLSFLIHPKPPSRLAPWAKGYVTVKQVFDL